MRTKTFSVEKTSFFYVFRKVLSYKWLQDYLSVIGRFTKSKFAKGKVSSRERPCFVVRKVMFQATKHKLWRGRSLPFALWNLIFRKMKNEGWRVESRFLQILTSLSSLFPDKILSSSLITYTTLDKKKLYLSIFLFYILSTRKIFCTFANWVIMRLLAKEQFEESIIY